MNTIAKFRHVTSKALLALFPVSHRIAMCKKSHTVAEKLILPAAIVEGFVEKLKLVPISNETLCRRIGGMAEDMYDELIDQMKQREFGLQLDETTEGSRDAHLVFYVCFSYFSEQRIVEELLFCKPIKLRCRGIDLFNTIDNFISTNNLEWEKVHQHLHRWRLSYVKQLLWTARSNSRTCIQGKVDVLHNSSRHREALVGRELSPLPGLPVEVVFAKFINLIKKRLLKSRVFEKFCAEMNAEH